MTAASAISPLRVTIVFGTRPEAIKLAPVARAFSARAAQGDPVQLRVVSTGQHDALLDDATAAKAADMILEKAKVQTSNGYKIPIAHTMIRRALMQLKT